MQFVLARQKRPSEKFPIGIDFAPDLEVGDNAQSKVVKAYDEEGLDVTNTFVDASSLAGTLVSAVIKAGVQGTRYRVVMTLTTAAGRIYEHEVLVDVSAFG